jgi:quercetin dioxygenase-like cupin family protein
MADAISDIWFKGFRVDEDVNGLSTRTTVPSSPPSDGSGEHVELLMEIWESGTSEPPHSHPGSDMTVVIEGKMEIQFYTKNNGVLLKDGEVVVLHQGQTGYIKAGRIHDAKYVEECKLVYIHDGPFGFKEE